MSNFITMLNLQLMLFLLMLVGVYLKKKGIVTAGNQKLLSDLLINVVLPFNIISAFELELTPQLIASALMVLAVSFGAQLLYLLYSKLFFNRAPKGQQMVMRYATICSNAGFMGNPIVEGVYGTQGLMYASLALIPLRIFMWTSGVSLFTTTDKKKAMRMLITHPCMVAVYIGIALLFVPFKLPVFLNNTIHSIGGCTSAISMFAVGTILADIDFKKVISKWVLFYSFVRLVVIPLSVWGILALLRVDPLLIGVTVILAAMPAGSTTAILAAKYDGDAAFASKCIFVSTILSLVTIPLITLVL